jgi:hypothetical protein
MVAFGKATNDRRVERTQALFVDAQVVEEQPFECPVACCWG